jgi:hypothetical protein
LLAVPASVSLGEGPELVADESVLSLREMLQHSPAVSMEDVLLAASLVPLVDTALSLVSTRVSLSRDRSLEQRLVPRRARAGTCLVTLGRISGELGSYANSGRGSALRRMQIGHSIEAARHAL